MLIIIQLVTEIFISTFNQTWYFCCHVNIIIPLRHYPRPISPVYNLKPYFLKIHLNIVPLHYTCTPHPISSIQVFRLKFWMDLLYRPHMSHSHPLHSDQCKEFLPYLLRIKYSCHTYFHLKLYISAVEDHCHITNIACSRRGEPDYHNYRTRSCLSYTYELMVFTNYLFLRQKHDIPTTTTYSLS